MDSVVFVTCSYPVPGLNVSNFAGIFKSYEKAISFFDSYDYWKELDYYEDLKDWREAEEKGIIQLGLIHLD